MEVTIYPPSESPLTSQSVASTVLHLPQTPAAVLPFSPIPGPGPVCLFPVSIFGQPPLQSHAEPILLLPASSLSLAQNTNTNTSVLSPKMASTLSLNQQLLLNTSQLPPLATLPLSQPHILQESSGQSIIVLPLGTNENLSQLPDKSLPDQSNCENKCIPADSTECNLIEKWTRSGANRRKSTKISELCSMRENSQKVISPVQTQASSVIGLVQPQATSSSSETSSETLGNRLQPDSLCNTLRNTGISQILSSLPPGWQVVGLTGLDQVSASIPASKLIECNPLSQDSPLMVSPRCKASSLAPSLVCVNLNNVSQPVASEALDNPAVNELTCCVKLDDIPCTQVISIKTEQVKEEETKPDSTSDDQSIKRPREKLTCVRKSRGSISDQTEKAKCSVQFGIAARKNPPEIENVMTLSSLSKSLDRRSSVFNEQWTIVGVTSIPQTTVKDVLTLSHAMNNTATVTSSSCDLVSSQSTDYIESSQSTDQSPDTIILKIPICPSSTNKGKRKAKVGANLIKDSRLSSVSSTPVIEPFKDSDASQVNKSEDIKWTIVGLTQTPLSQDETPGNIQNILPSGQSSVLSYPPNLTGANPSLLTPVLNNPTPNPNPHLLNIMSALSSTSQLMIQNNLTNQNNPLSQPEINSLGPDEVSKFQKDELSKASPDKNEWKVVGVTPLGLSASPVDPFTQVTPFPTMSSLVPVPLLLPTATRLPFIQEEATTCVNKGISSATLPTVSTPVTSTIALHTAAVTNTSVILPPPVSTCLNQLTPSDLEAFQTLSYQRGIDHLIENSSDNLFSPINLLKSCVPNHWNVVGMLTNSQVSLLDSEKLNTLTSNLNPQKDLSSKSVTSMNPSKETNFNDGPTKSFSPMISPKSSTVRQTLATKLKCTGSQSKPYKLKSIVKLNDSEHVKKNTVSSLLRLKRMQKGRPDTSHRLDSINYMDIQPKGDLSRSKARSLRSYAGNRSLFTKTREHNAEIRVFTGEQVSTLGHKLEESMVLEDQSPTCGIEIMSPQKDKTESAAVKLPTHSAAVKLPTHSAARKRKLKVPRRMIALDTDYHPFDTSSDSN